LLSVLGLVPLVANLQSGVSSSNLLTWLHFVSLVKITDKVCAVGLFCSAEKKAEVAMAGVTAGVAAMLANPLVAEAAVTPSLKNLLNSVVAGGVVLGLIVFAVTTVSTFDTISRK
jgi:hypothetical protein